MTRPIFQSKPPALAAMRLSIKILLPSVLALLLACPPAGPALAAKGVLDLTYGVSGKVTTNFLIKPDGSGSLNGAYSLAIQPDGKALAAGYVFTDEFNNTCRFALARYDIDGNLDTSFGSSGKVQTEISSYDQAYAIALQPDGKIIAAGFASVRPDVGFALVRYNIDGSLDNDFGSDGKVVTAFNTTSQARALAIQSDGKIVAAGTIFIDIGNTAFALARYNADGRPDTSFGAGGTVITDFSLFSDEVHAIAIQKDGKIVAAGFNGLNNGIDSAFAVVRYNTDGTLDSSFGSGGKVTNDFSPFDDTINALAIQSDGKIVAAGQFDTPFNDSDFAVARYNINGSLDTSFGSGGKVSTDFGTFPDSANALIIQSDGKIIAAGSAMPSFQANEQFGLARYNTDGSLDKKFGTEGKLTTDFGSFKTQAFALAAQSDGRVIAAGITAGSNMGDDFALARYETGIPRITKASISGKRLFVEGANYDEGADILLNGQKQKTGNNAEKPETELIGKKAGKKIAPGQRVTLQVKNSDGTLSPEFIFTRPAV